MTAAERIGYTARYTKIESGYLGQLVEWPEVVTEGTDLDECRSMLSDALEEMILAYRQQAKGKLYQLIKRKLKASGGEEALEGSEAAPDDADAQGALRQALKKRLAEDEAFRSELAALVEELAAAGGGVTQTAATTGNENVTVQITGDQNQVGWTGKGS